MEIKLKNEESVSIVMDKVKLYIKHNDIGISIDTIVMTPLEDVIVEEEQKFFDDIYKPFNEIDF